MTPLHHFGTWKIIGFIWAAGIAVVATEPSVKLAIIAGATAVTTTIVVKLMDRWFPSKQLQSIQAAQNRIEVSVDGNFKRMLDDKEKQDKLMTQADKDLARAEGHREGAEGEREKGK